MNPSINFQNPHLTPEYAQQVYGNPNGDEAKRTEAAQDFEAVFAQMMLKEMRPKMEGGLFNAGLGEEVFYQMLDEEIAKQISRSDSNFGIADQLMQQEFK